MNKNYIVIGDPFQKARNGKKVGNYNIKYRIIGDSKRYCITLATADYGVAKGRVNKWIEQAIAESVPPTTGALVATTPIATLIDERVEYLKNKKKSERYYGQIKGRLTKLVTAKECRFKFVPDINEDQVIKALARLQIELKLSDQTVDHWWKTIRAFTNWCCKIKKLPVNPLAETENNFFEGDIEATKKRRNFNDEEFDKLISNAERPEILKIGRGHKSNDLKIKGNDRKHIYLLAAGTGFRANEIASLTPAAFKLNGKYPTVEVSAKISKRRKLDVQTITRELADTFIEYLKGRDPDAPIWSGKWYRRAAKMLRKDMEGIKAKTSEGELDFHSLRHTFITDLASTTSVSAQTILEVGRLSTPSLLKRYTHLKQAQHQAAVEAISRASG